MLPPYKLKGRLQHRDAVRIPLMTDFIVVRQPTGPYALHRFRVLSLPANHRSLRPASDRILGASPPAECRLLSYL